MASQEEPPLIVAGAAAINNSNKNRRRRSRRNRKSKSKSKSKSYRNWADDLPWPALSLIMKKIGGVEVLMRAQWVCRSWWKASLDPCLWRITDMMHHADLFNVLNMVAMAMVAIDRSKGLLEEFYAEYFGSDELLLYIADRTRILKRLRLISAYDVSDEGLTEAVSRFPLLEELDLTHCSFTEKVCKSIGQACPRLKCFRLNTKNRNWHLQNYEEEDDGEFGIIPSGEAFGIANTMPELRQLQLVGNEITNEGLNAILDKCVHLESLDIRRCFRVNLDADLKAKCGKIKDLRLPNDSTEGYGWVFLDDYGSYREYFNSADDLYYEDYFDDYGLEFDDAYGNPDLFDDFFDEYY